jgi:hypothetical protein
LNPDKIVKYSVPFFILAIASRSIEEINFIYYAVPVSCVTYIVFSLWNVKSEKSKVKSQNGDTSLPLRMTKQIEVSIRHPASKIWYLVTIPGIWFLMTSLWSSHPEISAARALYFILISTGSISAGFLWMRYTDSDKSIFDFLLPANIVVLLSLFSLITNIPSDSWTGGHGKGFMGFFGHQNLLASVILFTLPSVFHRVVIVTKSRIRAVITIDSRRTSFAGMTDADEPSFRLRSESDGKNDTSYSSIQHPVPSIPMIIACCLLLTANLLVLALTYSRSALLSLLSGVIVFLVLNKKWKILSYSSASAAVFISIIYFTPSLNQFADKIIKKDFPEFYTSRIWMWEPSFRAALEGGVIGLGYGISDPKEKVGGMGDHFEGDRFVREKGNSLLALVEETGLIGLFLFIMPIVFLFIKRGDTRYLIPVEENLSGIRNPASGILHQVSSIQKLATSILFASLAAFIIHSQFEAWWVGVGSVQLPLFFIYLGLAVYQLSVTEKN